MFRISKLTDYSTLVMNYLAQKPKEIHTAKDITAYTHLALPTVSKILKILSKSKLLHSHRGSNGGYSLAKPAEEISIAAIVSAMDGNLALTECSTHSQHCTLEKTCQIRGHWQRISDIVEQSLQNITLADLAKPMQRQNIIRPLQPKKGKDL